MSRKSDKSSKRTATGRIDNTGQFAPSIATRAEELANQYTIVLQPHDRLGFVGHALEMPTVFVDGMTAGKCMEKMREALAVAVAVMLEMGEAPPAPSSEDRRVAQINIRLTAEEKLLIEQAAKQRGFRGISDFVRSVALSQTRRIA